MTDFLNPQYWRSQGIEPIVIRVDPDDDDSLEQGLNQVDQAIRDAVTENQQTETTEDS